MKNSTLNMETLVILRPLSMTQPHDLSNIRQKIIPKPRNLESLIHISALYLGAYVYFRDHCKKSSNIYIRVEVLYMFYQRIFSFFKTNSFTNENSLVFEDFQLCLLAKLSEEKSIRLRNFSPRNQSAVTHVEFANDFKMIYMLDIEGFYQNKETDEINEFAIFHGCICYFGKQPESRRRLSFRKSRIQST